MKTEKKSKTGFRILLFAGLTVFCAVCVFLATGASAHAALLPPDDAYIVVSLGDSYASGEGVEPFYDQELPIAEKVKSEQTEK